MRRLNRKSGLGLVIIALVLALSTVSRGAEPPVLTTAFIRGSTAYTPAELFAAYGEQIGRPITRESAQAIVAALERLYARDGYSRPEMKLDGDSARSGILRIEVIEPRITRVAIEGDAGPYRERLESLAANLRDAQPVRRTEVQRVLRTMREMPGLAVTADTRRDELQRNGFVLVVDASFKPVEGMVRLSNRGTHDVGPDFLLGQLVTNSLLGRGEKLGVAIASALDFDEYHGGGLFADAALGSRGTRAFFMGFHSLSDPSETPVQRADEYSRDRLTLRITHPLLSDGDRTVSISGTLESEDLGIERDGTLLRDDRLRSLELGGKYSWRSGAQTQYLATLDVRKGLDGLGSELYAPDLIDDPRRVDFLLARLQLVRLMRFNDMWSFRVDALGQYTGYVLPYSERFKVGGERIGRGFEVTEVAGDRGAGAKLELRRELTRDDTSWLGRTSVYSFYDIGATWSQSQSDNDRGRDSAATGGLGVSMNSKFVTGYLEIARPLTRADLEGEKGATLFAELSYRF